MEEHSLGLAKTRQNSSRNGVANQLLSMDTLMLVSKCSLKKLRVMIEDLRQFVHFTLIWIRMTNLVAFLLIEASYPLIFIISG